MSEASADDVMEGEKRVSKPTVKVLANHIESLQKQRKTNVNKMKGLIPKIKNLMTRNENASQVQMLFETLVELCENANKLHDMLIPLLPEDEQEKQNEWFLNVMKYTDTFKDAVLKWLKTLEENVTPIQSETVATQEEFTIPQATVQASSIVTSDNLQDDIKPNDSVSNVGSRSFKNQSSISERRSGVSSTSSVRLKAEAELAALKARQRLLKDKHELEDQEEQLRKRKEQLNLQGEIEVQMAKLNVLKSQSVSSDKSGHSGGKRSNLESDRRKTQILNASAKSFVPQTSVNVYGSVHDQLGSGVRPNGGVVQQGTQGDALGPYDEDEVQTNLYGVMRKQNEITTLLLKQQCLSSLPKRDLKVFDGDPFQYHAFMRAFVNSVESKTDNYSDCLYYLEQYTVGPPRDLVQSCQHIDPHRGYVRAKDLLHKHFGNEQKIASAYMNKALSWPQIKAEDVNALQEYSLFLRGCGNVMEELQYMCELNMPANMMIIIKKLPYRLRDKWRTMACELQERRNQRVSFIDIVNFIEHQVKVVMDPVFGNIQDDPVAKNKDVKSKFLSRPGIKRTSFATTVIPASKGSESEKTGEVKVGPDKKKCLFCEGAHTLGMCPQLGKQSHNEKFNFLKSNRVCFGCLSIGHISKECRKRLCCDVCGLKHPTLLHIFPKEKTLDTTEKKPKMAVNDVLISSGLTGAGDYDCKLPIVPVQIKAKKGSKIVTTYAFLDQGSTAVFCTESLMKKLNLTGTKVCILLRTMGQEKVTSSYALSEMEVAGLNGNDFCELPRVYTQESMPVHKRNIPKESDLQRWPHLNCVHLPEIEAGIELLIGTNVPKALEPLEVIRSVNDGPYAIKTMLGWTVNGPLYGDTNDVKDCAQTEVMVNRISVLNLEDMWQQQFKMDFPECIQDEQTSYSREDQKFMEMVTNSAKLVDGHYEIGLPLRKRIHMPNNRRIVEQRALHLKKRLQKDSVFLTDYKDFLKDMVSKGYAEQVPAKDWMRSDGQIWYIPHHGVYHPTKKKIRVVFDCGASYQGTSLNAQLLQGPDLTSSLIGVVTRFRKEPVVIMADIESMFHQVRIPSEDADLLRFLWWPDGDLSQDPTDFRMLVHLFGATSSPSCANFALRKCADDHKEEFNKETVDTILHSFYVDDCLVSVATVEQAMTLYQELVSLCAKGGFKLTKWMSNRCEVMAVIPEDQRAKTAKDLNIDRESPLVERVLGMQWCIQSDTFKFKIVIKDRPMTRRGILSMISSVYDPLGIVSPVLLSAKKILQDLCKGNLGWDDVLPELIVENWKGWLQELHLLESFELTRGLKPPNFGDIASAQLHHFSDASKDGYGTVTYLLTRNMNSVVHCAFIMGKSRVAPMKCVTIPRMELIAATMASRMDVIWRKELHLQLQDSVFWTDSASVLKYIKNETSRFKIFVANRVTEILKASQVSQWRYVDTVSNPADVASRGSTAKVFLKNRTWTSGPAFLLHPESEWPANLNDLEKLKVDDPEVKKGIEINSVQLHEEDDKLARFINHFSSWFHLKRAMAWILRFKKLLLSLSQKRKLLRLASVQSVVQQGNSLEKDMEIFKGQLKKSHLSPEELETAELEIIRLSQEKMFPDELACLKRGESVKKGSCIYGLCPTLNGVLRVGGRLSRASMPEESKHPVILAKNSHISDILLRHIHEEVGHCGRNHMLSKLRQKYWITGASTAIRSVLSKCVICRRLNSLPGCQQMADLPADRVTPNVPPFTHVGVDYFGPFEVKSRRTVVKRYGVIFTCLAIRAIHIEVAPSLDTDSFINALRRFIARRGQVKELRSDNGKNFVGAERELRVAIQGWNQGQINDVLLQKGIKWSFNPPTGSHYGGTWERLIRSVRKVLNSILKLQNLDEEGLQTVLCEVESILNGRPITKASTDSNDLEALTPNHLLILKTVPSLPPGEFKKEDVYARKRWRQVQYMSDLFWKRWVLEYLPQLQERQKWSRVKRNFKPGDIVLIVDNTAPRNSWLIGRIIQTFPDRRGFVRHVQVKTKTSCLERPITKICLLQEAEDG